MVNNNNNSQNNKWIKTIRNNKNRRRKNKKERINKREGKSTINGVKVQKQQLTVKMNNSNLRKKKKMMMMNKTEDKTISTHFGETIQIHLISMEDNGMEIINKGGRIKNKN